MRVTVNDGTVTSAPVTSAAVTVANSAPVFSTNFADRTDTVGDTANLDADATDADSDTLTYSATGLPTGVIDRARHGRHQRHARRHAPASTTSRHRHRRHA